EREKEVPHWLRCYQAVMGPPGRTHLLRIHCMFLPSLRRWTKQAHSASRKVRRQPRRTRLQCEEFEPRLQPSVFLFSTGLPDGKVATISEPANNHNAQVEYESADDFALTSETLIQ